MLFCDIEDLNWESVEYEIVVFDYDYMNPVIDGVEAKEMVEKHLLEHELRMLFYLPIDESMDIKYFELRKSWHEDYFQHHSLSDVPRQVHNVETMQSHW